MQTQGIFACLSVCLLSISALATAQQSRDTEAVVSEASSEAEPANAAEPDEMVLTLRTGTPAIFTLLDPIDTKTAKRGDQLRLSLSEDILVDGVVVIPKDSPAVVEIIHTQPAKGFGKAAELSLKVRYVEHAGRQFRGGRVSPHHGKDRTDVTLATSFAISVFAGFIKGGQIQLPAGTQLASEIREDYQFPKDSKTDQTAIEPAQASEATNPTNPSGNLESNE